MFSMRPIGFVRSSYTETAQIPKGRGAQHDAEGTLDILPELEEGLTDIEGFSHLLVIWVFDRVAGYDLRATPPTDTRPHGVLPHALRDDQTPSALPWSNCSFGMGHASMCAASTCWTARPSSTSNRISPACLRSD